MYTVLIQSKKTIECLYQFYPIFSDAIEMGKMSVCQWNEGGATVETALPELYEKIVDKQRWCAVIISMEESSDTDHPYVQRNPFDYVENSGRDGIPIRDGKITDSPIPLIHLTHLLGGYPGPQPEFEEHLVNGDQIVPKMEYRTVRNEKTEATKAAFRRWVEDHPFHAVPPERIYLIKLRNSNHTEDSQEDLRSCWIPRTEADSSEFCERNLYPQDCRFLVYDMLNRGSLHRQKDLFCLWTSVLTICINDVPSDMLQPKRLYKLDIQLNQDLLAKRFQDVVKQLNQFKYQIEKENRMEAARKKEIRKETPDFEIKCAFPAALTPEPSAIPQKPYISFSGSRGHKELSDWNKYRNLTYEEMNKDRFCIEHGLNYVASDLCERSTYAESEVSDLAGLQKEVMEESLDRIYEEILRFHGTEKVLPTVEMFSELDDKIKKNIQRKMTWLQAIGLAGGALGFLALGLLPGLRSLGDAAYSACILCLAALVIGILEFRILYIQRRLARRSLNEFVEKYSVAISKLHQASSRMMSYYEQIGSHMHGMSYLGILNAQTRNCSHIYHYRNKCLRGLEAYMSKIETWAAAMHVGIDMNAMRFLQSSEDADYDRTPSIFPLDGSDMVPVNSTGIYLKSPCDFIEKMILEREEVYDE